MDNLKKKLLEAYADRIKNDNSNVDDLLDQYYPEPTQDFKIKAGRVRNFQEDALAHQVMKKSKIKIPDKLDDSTTLEYLKSVIRERYPEIADKVDLSFDPKLEHMGGYDPKNKKIILRNNKKYDEDELRTLLATALHEGGHGYDDIELNDLASSKEITNSDVEKLRQRGKAGYLQKTEDIIEELAPDHHSHMLTDSAMKKNPELGRLFRKGKTYGAGALESMMKHGTFRSMAPYLAGGVGMAASGLVEAASMEGLNEGSTDPSKIDDTNIIKTLAQSATDPSIQRDTAKELQMRQQFGTGEEVLPVDEGESRKQKDIQMKALDMLRQKWKSSPQ